MTCAVRTFPCRSCAARNRIYNLKEYYGVLLPLLVSSRFALNAAASRPRSDPPKAASRAFLIDNSGEMNMPTSYAIDIMMSASTVQQLKQSAFALYGFKAVQTANGAAAPIVWFQTQAQSLLTNTQVNWTEQYQAYISTSQIIANGIITASSAVDADLGETANVDKYGNLNIVELGTASAISLNNQSSQPWTSGISQVVQGQPPSPMVALPLYGNMLDVIAPIEQVLLLFASPTVNTGTVIYKSYSSGVLVDLTGAPGNPASRTVMFDLNDGWSWGGAPWGTPVQAQEDLIPILIIPGS
jgi:hypothetical protein